MNSAYLVLENGRVFAGERFGAAVDAVGELVFTTGVVGYMELLTKPACKGQLVVGTFPATGCYGVTAADEQSDFHPAGFVVRACCKTPSNFRSEGDLDTWMAQKGIPGLQGVDTRAITALIRDEGTMKAALCADPEAGKAMLAAYTPGGEVAAVSTKTAYTVKADDEKHRVTLLDLGVEKYILDELVKQGCSVRVVPYDTAAADILAEKPNGVFVCDGPGSPNDIPATVKTLSGLLGKTPLFAVGLGHTAVALAMGGRVTKLTCGHHGANQPVRDLNGTRTYITTQHHTWAAEAESLLGRGSPAFVNVNDGTNEGMTYDVFDAMTVGFSPDACTAHADTGYLFKKFAEMMEGCCYAAG